MSAVVGNIEDLVEIVETAVEAAAGIASALSGFHAVAVARKYYDLYADQRAFYYSVFQAGVEAPMAAEITNEKPYTADYVGRMLQLSDPTNGVFGGAFADVEGWIARHAGMYSQTRDDKILELPETLARLKSDWANYLFRYEELWADAREDDRWAKRMTVHNIAVKQGTAAASAMDSGLAAYQDAIGAMTSQLATFSNGAAAALGYRRGLADTRQAYDRIPGEIADANLRYKMESDPVGYLYG